MENITHTLSRYVSAFTFEQIPAEAVETLKQYIADYCAAVFAGYRINEPFNTALREVFQDQCPSGAAQVFRGQMTSAESAAFLNAAYAHGADMDDGNKKAMGHIAAHVMSAVFALAQTRKATWGQVLTAVTVGYEVFNRLAGAAQPGIVRRGFHSTGVAGAMASGAACAKLMELDVEQIYSAISLAAVQSSGLLLITESGQACKPLNPANAARTGLLAAKLAEKGIAGPRNPLESTKGWFHAMSETFSEDILLDGLGQTLTLQESYLKPYASCRHTHCGIECALEIRRQMGEGFRWEDVQKIRLDIYPNAITVAGNVTVPESDEETKFSLHYSLTAALVYGTFGFRQLTVSAVTDAVRALISRTEIQVDEALENTARKIRGCRVSVTMADGAVYTHTVLAPKGEAENPFTWEDISAKLRDCAGDLLTGEACSTLLETIRNITPEADFRYLLG